jgi:membrane protein
MRLRSALSFIRRALREFSDDHPFQLSAALSYYTLLSLAPLVLVVVAVAGLVFGREVVQGGVVTQIRGLVGNDGAKVIETVLENATSPKAGILSLVIGVVTLIIGATTVFVQLQDALNQIWNVPVKKPASAIWGFIKERLLSLAMVLGVGFLLLVSLMVSAALAAVGQWAGGKFALMPALLQVLEVLVSFGVITLLFAMIFKILPDVHLSWRDVWFGAATTSALFTLGKYLIGLYLGRASIGSAYGAAGSIVVLLVWVYYASLIVFFGAELTQVRTLLREERGGRSSPARDARAWVGEPLRTSSPRRT